MNITFLIGNGFDLNLGLKTHFRNVLDSYCKEKSDDSRIKIFKKDISKDIENWSDYEKQIGIYTKKYGDYNIPDGCQVTDFCFCVKHFKEYLIKHLKKEQESIKYPSLSSKILEVFSNSILNFYTEVNSDYSKSLLKDLILKGINNGGIKYNFITFNYTNILDECLNIVKRSTSKYPSDNYSVNASISELPLSAPINIEQVLHIHGSVLKNPLIGVDNVNQIENKDLKKNEIIIRNIVKPYINDKLKNFVNKKVINLIDNSDIICLFGLSLGETDKTWWGLIGNWLMNWNKQLIIFNVTDPWNSVHADEEINNIDQIEKKFCSIANLSSIEEIDKIVARIHVGLNTSLFKLNLISQNPFDV